MSPGFDIDKGAVRVISLANDNAELRARVAQLEAHGKAADAMVDDLTNDAGRLVARVAQLEGAARAAREMLDTWTDHDNMPHWTDLEAALATPKTEEP